MNDPYRSIIQVSRDFITLIDRESIYVFANKAYARALGKNVEEIEGKKVSEIWGQARYEGAIEVPLSRCLDGEEVHFIDQFPFGDSMKYVEVRFFPYQEKKDGPITHALVITHDISRLGELETRLMTYEFRDPATGMFNRRSLDIILEREIQQAETGGDESPKVLFILSVDNLSDIRRQHGSEVATHIIENTGLRLKKLLAEQDLVFRSESDEISAVITHLEDPENVAPLAESALAAATTPYPKGVYEIRPECHLGIAVYPRDSRMGDQLLERAEAALSSARDMKVSYQFYDSDLHARSVNKLRLIAELRKSLFEDRFELHFQPIVDAAGKITGAESLIRWRHPEKGLLSPGEFLPLAEETGLITEMEKQVIFSAARHLARWKEYDIYLSINISACFFESDSLIPLLQTALAQVDGVPASRLKIEITESEGLSNTAIAMSRMKQLREKGFGVYIDDFGTGQSSLQYLKDLPATVLKIDKAFVDDIETVMENRQFLGHIIDLVRDRSRYSIIEGVENASQAAILAGMDVDALQGFFFSKPLPADQFEKLLKRGLPLPDGNR